MKYIQKMKNRSLLNTRIFCVYFIDLNPIYKTNHRDGHAYIIDLYDKEEDAFADFYQYVTHQINREKL